MNSHTTLFRPWMIIAVPLLVVAALAPESALAQLEWRIHIKWVHDLQGNPPPLTSYTIENAVAEANRILDGYGRGDRDGRGYHIRVIDEVDIYEANLPAPPEIWYCIDDEGDPNESRPYDCDPNDPNLGPNTTTHLVEHWFDAPFTPLVRHELDNAAVADYPGLNRFHWRPDAINVYMLHADIGGESVRSPNGTAFLLGIGGGITTPMHEIGHFMGLCHTFGCSGDAPEDPNCSIPYPNGDPLAEAIGDGIDDTLPDNRYWVPDDHPDPIAWYSFCELYANLPADDQERVNDVYRNVMSYHPGSADRVRFTPDQFDVMTDASNAYRYNITNGLTHFVDATGPGPGTGSSTDPYLTLTDGLTAAAQSGTADIVLMRTGSYDEPAVIDFPVCLRASRGRVVIGE